MKEPIWIDQRETVALHERLLAIHGGGSGLRDETLLQSALARPRQHYAYSESADLISLAAAYTFGIVRNHPFVDGNKRIGFVVGVLFLELNGYQFVATEEDATQVILHLAAGSMDEATLVEWMRANCEPTR